MVLLGIAIYSLITAFVFTQALQKIRLANHIYSLVEFLHGDVIQQLELALLGSPAARLLEVLVMGTQHQIASSYSTSMPSSPPSVPITGIMDTEGPVEGKASTSKILPPSTSADIEAASPKHCQNIPVLIPTITSRSSSLPSKLSVIVVPELVVLSHALPECTNHPWGCKDYRCQLYAF